MVAQENLLDGERKKQPDTHDPVDHYLIIIVVILDLVHYKIQKYKLISRYLLIPHAL